MPREYIHGNVSPGEGWHLPAAGRHLPAASQHGGNRQPLTLLIVNASRPAPPTPPTHHEQYGAALRDARSHVANNVLVAQRAQQARFLKQQEGQLTLGGRVGWGGWGGKEYGCGQGEVSRQGGQRKLPALPQAQHSIPSPPFTTSSNGPQLPCKAEVLFSSRMAPDTCTGGCYYSRSHHWWNACAGWRLTCRKLCAAAGSSLRHSTLAAWGRSPSSST